MVDITFRDSLYRAYGKTSSTSNAFVSNYVSHNVFNLDKITNEQFSDAKVRVFFRNLAKEAIFFEKILFDQLHAAHYRFAIGGKKMMVAFRKSLFQSCHHGVDADNRVDF